MLAKNEDNCIPQILQFLVYSHIFQKIIFIDLSPHTYDTRDMTWSMCTSKNMTPLTEPSSFMKIYRLNGNSNIFLSGATSSSKSCFMACNKPIIE